MNKIENIKERLKRHPKFKQWLLNIIVHPLKTRPRLWVRFFQFIYLKKGKGSVLYRSVRKDVVPFNAIRIGNRSVVEKGVTLNNMSGDLLIGDECHIGLFNTVIGPVKIGNGVITAQQVTLSGLNHNYEDVSLPIRWQGVSMNPITVEDEVWIGANSVILSGVVIGKHSIIGAGSVVTRSVPAYSVAVGNPARVVKKYDLDKKQWIKIV